MRKRRHKKRQTRKTHNISFDQIRERTNVLRRFLHDRGETRLGSSLTELLARCEMACKIAPTASANFNTRYFAVLAHMRRIGYTP